MSEIIQAEEILRNWKGDSYSFGRNVLGKIGEYAKKYGNTTLLCHSTRGWIKPFLKPVRDTLEEKGIKFLSISGARENAPREDLYRIALQIVKFKPDSIIAIGGGSGIDACKAASVLASYSIQEIVSALKIDEDMASTIEPFFGMGNVTKVEQATSKKIIPVIGVQTAASSAAHLTKYSNITDPTTGQKKVIVDDSIVPPSAVFDYDFTLNAPDNLTIDGGLDGLAHTWESFMGATGKDYYETIKNITAISTKLILESLR